MLTVTVTVFCRSFSMTVKTTFCTPSGWPETLNVALNGALEPGAIFGGHRSVAKFLSAVQVNVLSSSVPAFCIV